MTLPGEVAFDISGRPLTGGDLATESFKRATFGGEQPHELLILSGETRTELAEQISAVRDFLCAHPDESLADLSSTLAARQPGPQRLAAIASDTRDLLTKLTLAHNKLSATNLHYFEIRGSVYFGESGQHSKRGQVAFLFPGYGSYYAGMLADLRTYFPLIQEWFDCLDEIFDESGRELPSQLVFPSLSGLTVIERQLLERRLHDVKGGAQGGLTATLALYDLLEKLGLRCDVMVGHSNGETAALISSGTARFESRKELFKSMQGVTTHYADTSDHTPTGSFLGVSALDGKSLRELIAPSLNHLHLAMDNCPRQVVLFGSEAEIEQASSQFAKTGGICVRLPFDRAYHTPLYETQAEALRAVYNTIDFGPGRTRMYSCVTAQPFPDDPSEIRELALKQWTNPVKFRETIENLYQAGVTTFIEVGPNSTLTAFVDDVLRGKDYLAIPCNVPRRSGLEQLLRLLGRLFVHGMPLDLNRLFRLRKVNPVFKHSTNTQASTSRSGVRLSIFRSHQHLMQQFLESQSRVIHFVEAALSVAERTEQPGQCDIEPARSDPALAESSWPLLGEIVTNNSLRLHSRRRFELDTDLFLRDHTFGRRSSDLPGTLSPLPVVPFTISMEMLAEAGRYLGRGRKVAGLCNLRAHRWLALDRGSLLIELEAEFRDDGGREIDVRLFEVDETSKSERRLAFEGVVKLSDSYARAPAAKPYELAESAPLSTTAEKFYREFAFHGPCFQSLKKPNWLNEHGIEAIFQATPKENFFRHLLAPRFQIPADLLDAAGQLVYLWLIEQDSGDYPIFPFFADGFYQYVDAPVSESEVVCRAQINSRDQNIIDVSFDFLDQNERVIAQFKGLQLKRYRDPTVLKCFRPQGAETYFSAPFLKAETELMFRRMNVRTGLLEEGQGIWKRVLAHLLLSERERDDWHRLPEPGRRRAEWLMGRVAAKDVVRQWARETAGAILHPTEIDISSNEFGQPIVRCAKLEELGTVPNVSISHSGTEAIAVAAGQDVHVGIDIECIDAHTSLDWLLDVFTPREMELAEKKDASTLLSLWCAKEAVAKALGRGLGGTPAAWQVSEFSRPDGRATVAHENELFEVAVWYEESSVIAVCRTQTRRPMLPASATEMPSRSVA